MVGGACGGQKMKVRLDDSADDWLKGDYVPEIALLRAILHRSILDLADSEKQVRKEARMFFLDSLELPYRPFSFAWIAEELELDCVELLRRIEGEGLLAEDIKNPVYRNNLSIRGRRYVR